MTKYWKKHDFLILLVFENRSFDSVLGTLPNVDGIRNKNIVYRIHPSTGAPSCLLSHEFRPQISDQSICPEKDPNETYSDLYECFTDKEWKFASSQLSAFRNLPMDGFATNYYRALRIGSSTEPSIAQIQQITDVLSPHKIPVLTTLASQFGVADHYFCDVPSCTLPNRAFLQAASSNGNVTNGGYSGISSWLTNPSLTLFDILTEKDVPWKVYHDTKNVIPTSFVINFPHTSVSKAQFVPLEELFHDLEHGNLPAVSFCEPRFLGFPSHYHPIDSDSSYNHNSIIAGEQLLLRIYQAIRASKLKDRILFLITFDEGGGLADHVPPPRTASPYPSDFPTEMNFDFRRLGQRVPLIAVSSWIKPGTVIRRSLQHSSLLKSICRKYEIRKYLNLRHEMAPCYPDRSLFRARVPREWPDFQRMISQSPAHCILPDSNPHMYWIQKYILDQLVDALYAHWFRQQTSIDIQRQTRYVLAVLKVLESFGITELQPIFEIRFFLSRNTRVLGKTELQHAQNCRQRCHFLEDF